MKSFSKVALLVVLVASMAAAQTIKNTGTITNTGSISATTFNNYKGASPGTLNNNTGGSVTVSTTFNNALSGAAVTNAASIAVTGASGSFLNNTSGATVTNNAGGLIDIQGATSTFDNTGGTVANNTATASEGFRFVGAFTPGTGFDTQSGRVEYAGGGGLVYSAVVSNTYGALVINSSGTRTMDGGITSGDISISAGTFSVGNFKLTATGSAGIQGAGTLVANAGANSEVDYAGDSDQPIKGTTYTKLTLSGALAARNKQATTPVTVTGALALSDNFTTFDLNTNLTYGGTAANFSNANAGSKIAIAGNFSITDTATVVGNVDYDGGGAAQAIASAQYATLALSGAADKTFPTWNGTSVGAVYVSGSYSNTSGGATSYTGSIFAYNGGGAQTVAPETYATLHFYNAGVKSITGSVGASSVYVASSVNTGNGLFVNAGTLAVSGGDLDNDGTITNAGTITVN